MQAFTSCHPALKLLECAVHRQRLDEAVSEFFGCAGSAAAGRGDAEVMPAFSMYSWMAWAAW